MVESASSTVDPGHGSEGYASATRRMTPRKTPRLIVAWLCRYQRAERDDEVGSPLCITVSGTFRQGRARRAETE